MSTLQQQIQEKTSHEINTIRERDIDIPVDTGRVHVPTGGLEQAEAQALEGLNHEHQAVQQLLETHAQQVHVQLSQSLQEALGQLGTQAEGAEVHLRPDAGLQSLQDVLHSEDNLVKACGHENTESVARHAREQQPRLHAALQAGLGRLDVLGDAEQERLQHALQDHLSELGQVSDRLERAIEQQGDAAEREIDQARQADLRELEQKAAAGRDRLERKAEAGQHDLEALVDRQAQALEQRAEAMLQMLDQTGKSELAGLAQAGREHGKQLHTVAKTQDGQIRSRYSEAASQGKQAFQDTLGHVSQANAEAAGALQQAGQEVAAQLQSVVQRASTQLQTASQQASNEISAELQNAGMQLQTTATQQQQAIQAAAQEVAQKIQATFERLAGGLQSQAQQAARSLLQQMHSDEAHLLGFQDELAIHLQNTFSSAMQHMQHTAAQAAIQVQASIQGGLIDVRSHLSNAGDTLTSAMARAEQDLDETIDRQRDALVEATGNASDSVAEAYHTGVALLQDAAGTYGSAGSISHCQAAEIPHGSPGSGGLSHHGMGPVTETMNDPEEAEEIEKPLYGEAAVAFFKGAVTLAVGLETVSPEKLLGSFSYICSSLYYLEGDEKSGEFMSTSADYISGTWLDRGITYLNNHKEEQNEVLLNTVNVLNVLRMDSNLANLEPHDWTTSITNTQVIEGFSDLGFSIQDATAPLSE